MESSKNAAPELAEGEHLFTSESVTEGHPDKIADIVSDTILDACLAQDPDSRVACETLVNTGMALISGELSTDARIDVTDLVREAICEIGYDNGEVGYDGNSVAVLVALDKQSADIAQGVDEGIEVRIGGSSDEIDAVGAGDQGMMFGYATSETEELMPMPIQIAHRLSERLAIVRKNRTLDYLRPDGKTQVTVRYLDGRPIAIEQVLISTQHDEGVDNEGTLRPDLWENVVVPVLSEGYGNLFDPSALYESMLVNPTGIFVIGGPVGDAGLTGRKIIVDTYGGAARHGGGAFSGKDPSKVDRSAAYAARYAAKNVVASGLAERCEVQVAYAIGVARPISIMVETFGTGKLPDFQLSKIVTDEFDLRPGAFRKYLDLHRPIYRDTAAYGHFGRSNENFTWERTDRAQALSEAAGASAKLP
ncbi:MAG: methionine adenosyltransferase [Solirubrobacterales bacterium]